MLSWICLRASGSKAAQSILSPHFPCSWIRDVNEQHRGLRWLSGTVKTKSGRVGLLARSGAYAARRFGQIPKGTPLTRAPVMWHNISIVHIRPQCAYAHIAKVSPMKPVYRILAELYPEISPMAYYRELFPEELMESKGEEVRGKYTAIAIGLNEAGQAKRTQITKGLPQIEQLIASDDFVMTAPVLFAGRTASNEMARYLTALEFDLDFLRLDKQGEIVGIRDFLYQTSLSETDPFDRLPTPTYVIASSNRNLHVVYLLDKPLPMYPNILDSVRDFRRVFIPKLWDSYITEADKKPQFETSPVQAFRLVGSKTKHGDDFVRCYQTGARVSIDYLNKYSSNKIVEVKSSLTKEQAKEQYPEWYDKRIAKGLPKRTWECYKGLYEWWFKRMPEVKVGHRYHYLLCLAAYAQKCGISEDRLAKDMALCRQEMDKLSPPDNPLTMSDMAKALQCHQERYRTLPRAKISELSGLEITPNKRNGRSRAVHLEIARNTRATLNKYGEGHANNAGAPNKKDKIVNFKQANPGMSNREIASALGVSRNTVNKWLKDFQE